MIAAHTKIHLPATLIVGIDPGFTGALAVLDPLKKSLLDVISMPVSVSATNGKKSVDPKLLAEFLRPFKARLRFAVIEAVHSAPGQGVVSVFSFGQGYGTVLGVLGALDIPIRMAHPAVWKKAMGLSYIKSESNDLARKLFPESMKHFRLAKDNGKAEAVLLARYGERLAGFHSGSSDLSNLL